MKGGPVGSPPIPAPVLTWWETCWQFCGDHWGLILWGTCMLFLAYSLLYRFWRIEKNTSTHPEDLKVEKVTLNGHSVPFKYDSATGTVTVDGGTPNPLEITYVYNRPPR